MECQPHSLKSYEIPFPVVFEKFFRTAFLWNTSKQLRKTITAVYSLILSKAGIYGLVNSLCFSAFYKVMISVIRMLLCLGKAQFVQKVTFEPFMGFKQNHYGSWKCYKSCYF